MWSCQVLQTITYITISVDYYKDQQLPPLHATVN